MVMMTMIRMVTTMRMVTMIRMVTTMRMVTTIRMVTMTTLGEGRFLHLAQWHCQCSVRGCKKQKGNIVTIVIIIAI